MQFVCSTCFTDEELVGFIISQGKIGTCDCCHCNAVNVVAIEELLGFFKELFDNFQLKSTGKSMASLIQGNWELFRNLDIGHRIINNVLQKIDTSISVSDELVDFSDEIQENVNYWFVLKEQLKWERRYFTDINYLTDDLGWDGFFGSKTILKSDSNYYRARLHTNPNEQVFADEQMFCPPKELSTAGRSNPLGIPYLYLSDNEETILYEIRASYLDEVSIATFLKKETEADEIIISDFTEVPTLYHPTGVTERIKATLLKQLISADLSKPMRRYDSELDYLPTQFICEFIKVFTNVQGIKFRSSLHNVGNNIVVFNQNLMRCTGTKKVKVTNVNIKSLDL